MGLPEDANHPIYSLIRSAIYLIALTVILWLTASRFDGTELRTILYMFLAAAGAEVVPKAINALRGPPPPSQ